MAQQNRSLRLRYQSGQYSTTEPDEEVRRIQRELNELGYKNKYGNPLTEDGLVGSNTLFAVDDYFKDNGIVQPITANNLSQRVGAKTTLVSMGGYALSNYSSDDEKQSSNKTLDTLSKVLGIASLLPVVGIPADLAAAVVDAIRKDYTSVILDLLGTIPFKGEFADAAKLALLSSSIKGADDVADAAKLVNKTIDVKKTIKTISPSKLIPTHKPILSNNEYTKLVDSIKQNGITETIKYVEHNGKMYVVDGHHRLRAAKQLNLDNVPIEKVTLPYKGYKTVNDLLWFD